MFLAAAYAHDPLLLGMYLSTQLFTAAGDLGVVELTPDLLERFLTWTRTAQPHTNNDDNGSEPDNKANSFDLEVGL